MRYTIRTWGGERQHYEIWQEYPYMMVEEGDLEISGDEVPYFVEIITPYNVVLVSDRTSDDTLKAIKNAAKDAGIKYTNVSG